MSCRLAAFLLLVSPLAHADTPSLLWIPPDASAAEPARAAYRARIDGLEATRQALARALDAAPDDHDAIVAGATITVGHAIVSDLLPAWYGTPWDFNGTSQRPGAGQIACGYLVSTVLRDAGFRVERIRMAQQASEHIIQTVIAEEHIRRHRRGDVDAVVDAVRDDGAGVYLVGLDFHVGLLVTDGSEVQFCHASYVDPVAMLCEPARSAVAMRSKVHVVGRLLGPETVARWVRGEAFATRTP